PVRAHDEQNGLVIRAEGRPGVLDQGQRGGRGVGEFQRRGQDAGRGLGVGLVFEERQLHVFVVEGRLLVEGGIHRHSEGELFFRQSSAQSHRVLLSGCLRAIFVSRARSLDTATSGVVKQKGSPPFFSRGQL